MSYRSKRTRIAALNESRNASEVPPKKAQRAATSQLASQSAHPHKNQPTIPVPSPSLKNKRPASSQSVHPPKSQPTIPVPLPSLQNIRPVSSQSVHPPKNHPTIPVPSPSLQNTRGTNDRWGPFNPQITTSTQRGPSSSTTTSNLIWKKPLTVPTTSEPKVASKEPSRYNPTLDKTFKSPNIPTENPTKVPQSRLSEPPKHPSTVSLTSQLPYELAKQSTYSKSVAFDASILEETLDTRTGSSPTTPEDEYADHISDGKATAKSKESCDGKEKEIFKGSRSRCHESLPEWLSTVEYDNKEQVLTIDAKGNQQLVSGSIQPMDVWNTNGSIKYVVHFNELYQPIRKGGHILVRFLGSIAKQEQYCPVSEKTWGQLDNYYKVEIIKLIRDNFVIPDDTKYEDLALQRVDRVWRQYKYEIKKKYFKPNEKTIEAIKKEVPPGVSKQDWVNLVNYWDSSKGKVSF
ncbi:uncharacterized protein [Spinacia oleracea]|uniref:Uncharacterized protein n=1 Tax=Spinacia oleracea TaxID=3562 RepID=A0ABM3RGS8_SPIOL|nr:uncharacterized protein LOC130469494 [Spinacia oleracea]